MELEGYLISKTAQPMTQPMTVKHDYRNVKVAENTTITIDFEELKKQMKKEFYKQAGLGINFGA